MTPIKGSHTTMKLLVLNHLKHTVRIFYQKFNLSSHEKTKGRKLAISLQDSIALGLYKQSRGSVTKRSVYDDLKSSLSCSYKTFVVSLNRFAYLVALILIALMRSARTRAHTVKHIDATDIPVCLFKNARRHHTMRALAKWGRSGKGLYYGLKLHIVTDLEGRLLNFCFTPANTDDRSPVTKLVGDMQGIFIADAGYISQPLATALHVEGSRIFMAKAKRNMKKLMSVMQYTLYRTRMLIELNFRSLKMFHGLLTSLPRSIDGYLANYLFSILSYIVK